MDMNELLDAAGKQRVEQEVQRIVNEFLFEKYGVKY